MIAQTMMPPKSTVSSDDFQTPPCALEPLWPYIRRGWNIWEPAAGSGNLAGALIPLCANVFASDLAPETPGCGLQIRGVDFLTWVPEGERVDCIITNPPFSLKDEFLARCYELGKPFALLLPITALEGIKRQALYRRHGVEVIILPRRLNFETPSGEGGGAWFPAAWFTWGMRIGGASGYLDSSLTFWEGPPGWGREPKPIPSKLKLNFGDEVLDYRDEEAV